MNKNTFIIQPGHFLVHDGKTMYRLYVDEHRVFSGMPKLDDVYNWCLEQKWSPDRIIDFMLRLFHRRRLIKGDYLGAYSLVTGIIGGRGGGKSCAATQIGVIDYLLAGYTVYSNMEIGCKVKYRDAEKDFSSIELDKVALLDVKSADSAFERKSLILVDELNQELGDALRSTTNKALFWSYVMQQIRKKQLDIIWTTQDETWTTNRTRFQTDIYIACRDAMFIRGERSKKRKGRKSLWKVHDMSGIVTGDILYTTYRRVQHYKEVTAWNTPYWGCYDHEQLQGIAEARQAPAGFNLDVKPEVLEQMQAEYGEIFGYISDLLDTGLRRIGKRQIWAYLGVDEKDRSMQTKIGSLLTKLGLETKHGTDGDVYIVPDKVMLEHNLEALGFMPGKGAEAWETTATTKA